MLGYEEPLVGKRKQLWQTPVPNGSVITVTSGRGYLTSVTQGGPLDGWELSSGTLREAHRTHWGAVKMATEVDTYV